MLDIDNILEGSAEAVGEARELFQVSVAGESQLPDVGVVEELFESVFELFRLIQCERVKQINRHSRRDLDQAELLPPELLQVEGGHLEVPELLEGLLHGLVLVRVDELDVLIGHFEILEAEAVFFVLRRIESVAASAAAAVVVVAPAFVSFLV